uniref:Uncharacterized protein n=1 Tax=Anolis carolinensis TaxID=28377 RepID=A0A803SSA8_ANOCA
MSSKIGKSFQIAFNYFSLGFFDCSIRIGFNLQLPIALAPSNSLSFAGLNPSIDFSSFAIKVVAGIFFQHSDVSSS